MSLHAKQEGRKSKCKRFTNKNKHNFRKKPCKAQLICIKINKPVNFKKKKKDLVGDFKVRRRGIKIIHLTKENSGNKILNTT